MRIDPLHLLCAFLMTPLCAQQPSLAVVEKKAGFVAFYSVNGERLSEVKVGRNPHEMAFSLDRRFLYVTDNGLVWMTDKGEGDKTISIIDVASRKKSAVIDLGNYRRPHGMIVHPKTGNLIVTIENPYGLLLVDPAARKVLRKFETKGESPHMVLFGPKSETAYVSNSNSGNVAVLNLATGVVEKLIPTGKNPQGGVMTRDGKWIYLTNTASNMISVIDTEKREVVGEIKTGNGPARIFLTPDEKTLVYNLQLGEGVAFADVSSRQQVAEVRIPGRPLSLSCSRDNKTAYLGLQDSDKIAVVSIPERKLIRVIGTPIGAGPDTVAPLD